MRAGELKNFLESMGISTDDVWTGELQGAGLQGRPCTGVSMFPSDLEVEGFYQPETLETERVSDIASGSITRHVYSGIPDILSGYLIFSLASA